MKPDFKAIALMALGKGNAPISAFDGLKDIGILSHEDIAEFCNELEGASDHATLNRMLEVLELADDSAVRAKPKVIGHIKAVLDAKKTPLDNDLGMFLQMYLHCAWGVNSRPDEVEEPEKPAPIDEKTKPRSRKAVAPAAPPIEIGAVPDEPATDATKGDGTLKASRGRPVAGRPAEPDRPAEPARVDRRPDHASLGRAPAAPPALPKAAFRPGAWNDPLSGEIPHVEPAPSVVPPVAPATTTTETKPPPLRLVRREEVGKKPEPLSTPKDEPAKRAANGTLIWHGVGAFLAIIVVLTVLCMGTATWFKYVFFPDPDPMSDIADPGTSYPGP